MKRVLLLTMLSLVLSVVPRTAFAAADATTDVEIHGTSTSTVDLCGTEYVQTLTYNGVSHSTEVSNGLVQVRVTIAGSLTAVPTSGTGPAYTGRYTESFGFRQTQRNGSFTWTIVVIAVGSDGSRLRLMELTHMNQSASGLEFGFERVRCSVA